MSFAASVALQGAVYQHLRADAALHDLVGDAIFDAMPVDAPAGVFVSLGPEDVRDAGDMTAAGSQHDFVVSVLSGTDQGAGFAAVKAAAVAVLLVISVRKMVPAAASATPCAWLPAEAATTPRTRSASLSPAMRT